MFGKLLKYEFKSIGKWYFALNAGTIVIAAILSFTLKYLESQSKKGHSSLSWATEIFPFALSLIFGFLIAGSLLATLIIIINRFNKNIFEREGYLTMTLPVSEHQLILSKLLSSVIFTIFNGIALLISIFIITLPQIKTSELLSAFSQFGQFASKNLGMVGYGLLYGILSLLSGILLIYLSISIGQLFANRRGLKAFITYALITVILSIIFFYINLTYFGLTENLDFEVFKQHYMLVSNGELLFETILFYFATHFIMKYKLNLQ